MKRIDESMLRRGRDGERGQALVMVPALLALLLAAAALVIDMGNMYFSYQQLLSATEAAAKAGGSAMANPAVANVKTYAEQYGGQSSGDYNYHPNLNITNVAVNYACVPATTYPNLKLPPCATFSSYPGCTVTTANPYGGCNAIQVTETAQVPTFFAKLFGVPYLNISATASASTSGGGAIPYHIMMVLDTTSSMGSTNDSGCLSSNPTGTYTAEQCAQLGVQTLLQSLAPCAANLSSCTGASPVDQVGVMAFPGICSDTAAGITGSQASGGNCPMLPTKTLPATLTNTTANSTYAPDDYGCNPKITPPIADYNNNPEYLIVGFPGNDYRNSDASNSGLNFGSSNLVNTVGALYSNCGMPTPGGEGTFYAGIVIAAQQYLMAKHTSGIQDVMIVLSDGNATASSTQMGGVVPQSQTVAGMNGSVFSDTNECAQAVAAANWAKGYSEADGTETEIYSVSYNSQNVQCQTDKTAITDCTTMQDMGSTPSSQYFFSVPGKTNGTICSGAVPITYLDQVFSTIGGDLGGTRLIPNGIF